MTYELLKQIVKFALVGVLNTGVDFAVLNVLSFSFSVYSGFWVALFNIISFSAAVTNSYFWNRYWTFRAGGSALQFAEFFVISVGGAVINTGVVYSLTTFVDPVGGLSPALWLNVAKIIATPISMAWNFVGYKFLVFRK